MSMHVTDLLGAWALDVCDEDEVATVEAHLEQCDECAAQAAQLRSAAGWLGAQEVVSPPPQLRETVLEKARQRRAPVVIRTLIEAYATQVTLLDRALRQLTPADWHAAEPHHGDLATMIRHLTVNDAALAADLSLPVAQPASDDREMSVYTAWRDQSDLLLRGLHEIRGDGKEMCNLDRTVSLAERSGRRCGSLRDSLVQRAFETWIHHDDVRFHAGGEPSLTTPPPEQVRRIVSLAVAALPAALAAHGLSQPGRCRLVLAGQASGDWTFPLGGSADTVSLTLSMDAVDFARLAGNRRSPESLHYAVEGDTLVAKEILRVASTLGCD